MAKFFSRTCAIVGREIDRCIRESGNPGNGPARLAFSGPSQSHRIMPMLGLSAVLLLPAAALTAAGPAEQRPASTPEPTAKSTSELAGESTPTPKPAASSAAKSAATQTATSSAATPTASAPLLLHVPSPDWRDQIIYFLMLDRFDDGRPDNNDQGHGEYDPGNGAKYSGGDLAGVIRRLDYIQALGATAVWTTPPVANQWWDGSHQFSGYHGYWAEHFKRIDAHNGTLADYQQLSHELHSRGMYLVQDVVVNHTGNFFRYTGPWSATSPEQNVELSRASRPVTAPTQWPFSLNDVRNPEHRKADIYHWTPVIGDFTDHHQETTFQLADLDDLNTENPLVRRALRDSYGYWIRAAGVDAFRIDTAFHVPPAFFADFLHADDSQAPGVLRVAAQTGRTRFHVFGEGFGVAPAYDDKQALKVDRYMRATDGTALLPGMINFPLYGSIVDVFARGRPTAELSHRIRRTMTIHQQPHLMPTFVDNHDVDRFLAGGSEAGLKQALLLIMTLPGIPTLYYGTEQGFREQRAAMFANGHGAMGRDHFDAAAPLYRFIQQTIALRRAHPVLSRGSPTILADNAATAGVLAYRMRDDSNAAIIVFNTAGNDALLDNLDTGLPAGTVLEGVFAIDGRPQQHLVGADGRITLPLPPHSGFVWKVSARKGAIAKSSAQLTLAPLAKTEHDGDFTVSGTATSVRQFQLIVDGDLQNSQTITPDRNGHWQANIRTDSMIDPTHQHRVVAWSAQDGVVSAAQSFRVSRTWQPLATFNDPVGDDHGPTGRYRYPTDSSWHNANPLDIRTIQISGSGGAVKIHVQLQDLIASWNPPNGFDHLALTLFLQIPGKPGGSTIMPFQNGKLPNGMRWHYRLRTNGWSNALFTSDGASAANEGTSTSTSATLQIDRDNKTLSFLLPAAALGNLTNLSGLKLYVTSWDYDGGYKPLTPTGAGHGFTGGDGSRDPLVMDDTDVVTVP